MFKHFTKRKNVSLSKAELKKERVSAWLKKMTVMTEKTRVRKEESKSDSFRGNDVALAGVTNMCVLGGYKGHNENLL